MFNHKFLRSYVLGALEALLLRRLNLFINNAKPFQRQGGIHYFDGLANISHELSQSIIRRTIPSTRPA